MQEGITQQEEFSIVKRAKSLTHACRGIAVFIRTTHNAWIHLAILACVTMAGFFFHITTTDWMLLVLAAGLVLTAEAINTAIEIDIDLTSPDYHPFARDTKDVAAGAVLIAAVTAAIIGFLIFVPYLIVFIGSY